MYDPRRQSFAMIQRRTHTERVRCSDAGEFRVSVAKDYLVFASAHFHHVAGHRCEGLHGHNYRHA